MLAATIDHYGPAESVKLEQIECPDCGPDEVVVATRAASVNPYDWHMMAGSPLLVRLDRGWLAPKSKRLGVDIAGVIKAVGSNVTKFSLGEEVFGCATGSFAEFASAEVDGLARKPANVSYEDAAAVGIGALTAVQGLRDHGRVERGQHVLINGASGGVGTYAVQLAKYFGAAVTGVCSTKNLELVRVLGADEVVDYTTDDFAVRGNKYDLILDLVGNRRISDYKRCLTASGTYVVVSGSKNKIFGPLWHMMKSLVLFKFGTRRAATFIAKQSQSDLELIGELLASGVIRSVVGKVYPLNEVSEALSQIETGHTQGKIVIEP